ncbi:MAG: transglycosylase domain-containing protein, partial [Acidobacteriota bacterium]
MGRKRSVSRKSIRKGIILFFCLSFLFVVAGILLYCWHLSVLIEERFSARKWSIPSKVFSDSTLLYPGQQVNRSLLKNKLLRLEYRNVPHGPKKSGEMRVQGSDLELYLHDLDMPSKKRKGFPVKISFRDRNIESILRQDHDETAPLLELKPEKIMLFFGPEREQRQLVSIDRGPGYLTAAILTAEDSRFYTHGGIDVQAVFRALYVNIRHGTIRQGGSTLTQQLAKNYFLTPVRTFVRKAKELLMALMMEAMYEKNEILEIYLNEIYLGQKGSVSINGVGEASFFYFGKSVEDLSLAEAATVASLIKGPGIYSPYVDKRKCRDRRDKVLRDMENRRYISPEQLKKALSEPVKTAGFTVYGKKAPYFVDYVSKQLPSLYSDKLLSSLGLSIYTTLDTQVQEAAERALERGLARLEKSYPSLSGQKLRGSDGGERWG